MIPKFRAFWHTEGEKWKTLDRHQRLLYLWDYYKIPIGAAVLVLALVIYTLCYQMGRGKIDLYAVLVNAGKGDSQLFSQALEDSGFSNVQVSVDTSLTYYNAEELAEEDISTIQVLYALFSMGDMDLFAADPGVFDRYTAQDGFEDLSLLLPQSLLEANADRLIRYQTENGQEKIGGILLESDSPLHKAGFYSGSVAVGIAARCEHLDEALAVIEYLLTHSA